MYDQSTDIIKRLQRSEVEILDEFHKVCKNKHLRYSLFYGTLVGAVRHQGFIPWDDDIDIMMPRKDYDELLRIWKDEADSSFILQTYFTESDYANNFAKIRRDRTTFLQSEDEKNKIYHKGIFIDIFPADRVAPGPVSRKIQFFAEAINLLYSRGYTSGTNGMIGRIERILLLLSKKKQVFFRNAAERIMTHWNNRKDQPYVCSCTIECCGLFYPADMFDSLKKIQFEGKKYFSVTDTDTILRVNYDDYMKLPPESERVWAHHPLEIDFDHNYEENHSK